MSRKVKVVLFLFVLAIAIICSAVEPYHSGNYNYASQQVSTTAGQPQPPTFAQLPLLRPETPGDEEFSSLEDSVIPLQLSTSSHDTLRDHAENIGVLSEGEGFSIITPGWYRIYAQVLYEADRLCSQYKEKEWKLTIMLNRFNGSSDFDLPLTYDTYICEHRSAHVRETVYVEIVTELMAADKVYVTVSADAPLSSKAHANYAGLHLLKKMLY